MESSSITQLKYSMCRRLVLKKLFVKCIFLIPVVGFLYFFLSLLLLSDKTVLIATTTSALFLIFLVLVYEITEFNSVYYDAKDTYLIIKTNITDPSEHMIEYRRIKEIEFKRDIFDILFGLRTLSIKVDFSNGTIERTAIIEGLNSLKADGLKKLILDLKKESEERPPKPKRVK